MKLGKVMRCGALMAGVFGAIHGQAGTNDLFEADASLICRTGSSRLRLTNATFIELAQADPLSALSAESLRVGLEADCAARTMQLVVYDDATKVTVTTLADLATVAFRSNGKFATVWATGTVSATGWIVGGDLAARARLRLDEAACASQSKLRLRGTLVTDLDGLSELRILRGTLKSRGPELRDSNQTGFGNWTIDGGGGIVTNIGGGGWTIGGGPVGATSLAGFVVGMNSTVTLGVPHVSTNGVCSGRLIFVNDLSTTITNSLGLCATATITLGDNSVLNLCTNGLSEELLAPLLGGVTGTGTLNLLDCSSP